MALQVCLRRKVRRAQCERTDQPAPPAPASTVEPRRQAAQRIREGATTRSVGSTFRLSPAATPIQVWRQAGASRFRLGALEILFEAPRNDAGVRIAFASSARLATCITRSTECVPRKRAATSSLTPGTNSSCVSRSGPPGAVQARLEGPAVLPPPPRGRRSPEPADHLQGPLRERRIADPEVCLREPTPFIAAMLASSSRAAADASTPQPALRNPKGEAIAYTSAAPATQLPVSSLERS